ncbi:hypothetical protein L1887_47186 [Cichorium endivia]|nr:hypothetical protein L1887_47186 [Cichorium endivia]
MSFMDCLLPSADAAAKLALKLGDGERAELLALDGLFCEAPRPSRSCGRAVACELADGASAVAVELLAGGLGELLKVAGGSLPREPWCAAAASGLGGPQWLLAAEPGTAELERAAGCRRTGWADRDERWGWLPMRSSGSSFESEGLLCVLGVSEGPLKEAAGTNCAFADGDDDRDGGDGLGPSKKGSRAMQRVALQLALQLALLWACIAALDLLLLLLLLFGKGPQGPWTGRGGRKGVEKRQRSRRGGEGEKAHLSAKNSKQRQRERRGKRGHRGALHLALLFFARRAGAGAGAGAEDEAAARRIETACCPPKMQFQKQRKDPPYARVRPSSRVQPRPGRLTVAAKAGSQMKRHASRAPLHAAPVFALVVGKTARKIAQLTNTEQAPHAHIQLGLPPHAVPIGIGMALLVLLGVARDERTVGAVGLRYNAVPHAMHALRLAARRNQLGHRPARQGTSQRLAGQSTSLRLRPRRRAVGSRP